MIVSLVMYVIHARTTLLVSVCRDINHQSASTYTYFLQETPGVSQIALILVLP
jgi:hypothetical protein